ncbi:hypothetical protein BH11PLA2_BH11PLA2_18930 [soil metagenome]
MKLLDQLVMACRTMNFADSGNATAVGSKISSAITVTFAENGHTPTNSASPACNTI